MKVQINIRGRNYTVRSDEADEDLVAIAKFVDGKMAEIAGKASSMDDYTVAMLAALNIASEYDRFRREVQADLIEVDRNLAGVTALLTAALPSAGEP